MSIRIKKPLEDLLLGVVTAGLLFFASTGHAVEQITYYHNDALGSPVAATDNNGTLLWREAYEPYGERLDKEAPGTDTVWFTGKQEESLFGLSYFGARWYDPEIGRFMAVDPAGFNKNNIHSFNKYAYANNNPYTYIDPDGRAAVLVLIPPALDILGKAAIATGGFLGGLVIWDKYFNGAKEGTPVTTEKNSDEWVYGPENDPKINDDGSTEPNTWTSPDDYGDQQEAQDKLDPFKPLDGRRPVRIPAGTTVKKGNTPGREGPFSGSGGGNETLILKGLPPGSAGKWKPLK